MSTVLNPDQFVDLYHFTTPDAAGQIERTGRWLSKENTQDVYFTTDPDSEYAKGFGSSRVHVQIDAGRMERIAQLNDEFPSGEQHFAINRHRLLPTDVREVR